MRRRRIAAGLLLGAAVAVALLGQPTAPSWAFDAAARSDPGTEATWRAGGADHPRPATARVWAVPSPVVLAGIVLVPAGVSAVLKRRIPSRHRRVCGDPRAPPSIASV